MPRCKSRGVPEYRPTRLTPSQMSDYAMFNRLYAKNRILQEAGAPVRLKSIKYGMGEFVSTDGLNQKVNCEVTFLATTQEYLFTWTTKTP